MILSHYPSAQGPQLPICMVLGEKPHRTSTFPPFLFIHPRTCLENLKVKVEQIQSPCTSPCTPLLLLYGFMSHLKAGGLWGRMLPVHSHSPWGSSRSPEPCLLPAWHRAMPAPRLQITAGCASTSAEHHMPKPPQGFACGHMKEPRERGISLCCRRSRGERRGGARGRDVGRYLQEGEISSEHHSCRGATGPAANCEGPSVEK